MVVHDIRGMHHFHKRKRVHQKLEKYPSKDKLKRKIDWLIYAIGVFGPVMTIPQLWDIWVGQNASGVSLISWSAYLISAIVWFGYGYVHKEKPIMFVYSIWIIMEALIVIGVIIYG